jgi:KDO2-lipid IV(A) lauroyltransferase
MTKLRYALEAWVFFACMALFRLLGLDAASALGGWIGRNLLSLLPPDRIARANLAAAFPEKSQTERDAIRRQMWDNLGRVVAEYPHFGKFSHLGRNPRITWSEPSPGWLAQYRDQATMYLSAHLANWEIMHLIGHELALGGTSVIRPPNNPIVARWLSRRRSANGSGDQITKRYAMRRMLTRLQAGKSLSMLIDQKLREGVAVPFFGRAAMTTPAPAALKLRTGAKIVIVSNRRTRGAHFHVTYQGEVEFTASGRDKEDIAALTALLTARKEKIIRADPAQWLWIHNRWGS